MCLCRHAAAVLLAAVLVACAQPLAPPVTQVGEQDLKGVKEALRAGNGFTCTGNPGGAVFGCRSRRMG